MCSSIPRAYIAITSRPWASSTPLGHNYLAFAAAAPAAAALATALPPPLRPQSLDSAAVEVVTAVVPRPAGLGAPALEPKKPPQRMIMMAPGRPLPRPCLRLHLPLHPRAPTGTVFPPALVAVAVAVLFVSAVVAAAVLLLPVAIPPRPMGHPPCLRPCGRGRCRGKELPPPPPPASAPAAGADAGSATVAAGAIAVGAPPWPAAVAVVEEKAGGSTTSGNRSELRARALQRSWPSQH